MFLYQCVNECIHPVLRIIQYSLIQSKWGKNNGDLITLNGFCETAQGLTQLRWQNVLSQIFFTLLSLWQLLNQCLLHIWVLIYQLKHCLSCDNSWQTGWSFKHHLLLTHLLKQWIHQIWIVKEICKLILLLLLLNWILISCRCWWLRYILICAWLLYCLALHLWTSSLFALNWLSWLWNNAIYCLMDLGGSFSVLVLVGLLHPEEVSLLRGVEFQKVNSVLWLLHFLKLCITRENVKTIQHILCLTIQELELFHACVVLADSKDSLSPVWLNHASIIGHLASLELDQCFHLRMGTSH